MKFLTLQEISNTAFYKQNETDSVWWIDTTETKGEHLFTFDKCKIFNLFEDYPDNLTAEELCIFNTENPFWADFFLR